MKRALGLALCLVILVTVSGCIKTHEMQVRRKDQALVGNRGVIMGEVPPQDPDREKTRTVKVIDIEMPPSKAYKEKRSSIERGLPEVSRKPDEEKAVYEAEEEAYKRDAAETEPRMTRREMIEEKDKKRGFVNEEWVKEKAEPEELRPEPVQKRAEKVSEGPEEAKATSTKYTIQKGDTLEKIAKKFYGSVSRWTLIYEANKESIKDPSRIYPGQEISIPPLPEEKGAGESDYK